MELRPRTFVSYKLNVETHIIPRLGHFRLQGLSPLHIKSFYADLLADGRRDGGGGLSPRTVQYIGTILGRALRDAESQRLIQRNPAAAVRKPKPSSRKGSINTWTSDELRRFLGAIEDERIFPALLLAATTGLRRGELLGLTWRDADLDASRLRVVQALVVVGAELRLSPPKRESSVRSIALDPTTVEVLHRWRNRQREERLAWGPAYNDQDLVFSREDGSPINPDWLTRRFASLVGRVDVPSIRLHDLRHTHATLALQANVHPKVVAERLGHSSVMITLDTYSHAIPSLQAEAAERVAGVVFGV
jgi:integrase